MTVTAQTSPKALFEQLENAVLFSVSDKPVVNDTIYVSSCEGRLITAGRGLYCAAIDSRSLPKSSGEAVAILDATEVSEAVKAAKKVKGFGGKTAECDIEFVDQGLTFSLGAEVFTLGRSELSDDVESTEESEGIYDHLFRMIAETRSFETPHRMVILRQMMKLLDKVKHGETSKDEDPFSFLVRPEGEYGNGLMACRIGPVKVYEVLAEVD